MNDKKNDACFNTGHHYSIPLALLADNLLLEFPAITHIGQFPQAKYHYHYRKDGIDETVIIYCREGSGFYSINNSESRIVRPGQILVLPPGVPHGYGASEHDPWTILWMHIKGNFLNLLYGKRRPARTKRKTEDKTPDRKMPELVGVSESTGKRVEDFFLECFNILELPYQWEEYFYLCQCAAAVISLIPIAAKRSLNHITADGNHGIEAAISYMKSNLHESITLKDLSLAAGFSQSHLHNLFQKSSGYSPIEYFLRMKIQAAAKDIFFSSLTIGKIAEAYGIDDPYYFSRLFKKTMGLSPQQYRKTPRMIDKRQVPV